MATPSKQVRHRIDDVDVEARTAVCRLCGPVSLVWKSGRWACEAKGRDARREHLMTRYGITPHMYDTMVAVQQGRCAICQREFKLLHVDHDHATGHVRGLLCGNCNRALGMLDDNVDALRRAIDYLEGG